MDNGPISNRDASCRVCKYPLGTQVITCPECGCTTQLAEAICEWRFACRLLVSAIAIYSTCVSVIFAITLCEMLYADAIKHLTLREISHIALTAVCFISACLLWIRSFAIARERLPGRPKLLFVGLSGFALVLTVTAVRDIMRFLTYALL